MPNIIIYLELCIFKSFPLAHTLWFCKSNMIPFFYGSRSCCHLVLHMGCWEPFRWLDDHYYLIHFLKNSSTYPICKNLKQRDSANQRTRTGTNILCNSAAVKIFLFKGFLCYSGSSIDWHANLRYLYFVYYFYKCFIIYSNMLKTLNSFGLLEKCCLTFFFTMKIKEI